MESTKVVFFSRGYGEVQIFSGTAKVGKMKMGIANGNLTAYHTEVDPAFQNRGFAKLLLNQLVAYAREQGLKIIPLCPYVNAQFRSHPAEYADIWLKA
jgi:uncharacterized protein